MIWSLLGWVLALALAGAALYFWDAHRLAVARLEAQRSRSEGLRDEITHWIDMYSRIDKQREAYQTGIDKIINLRTRNMANIGQRMFSAAASTLRNVEALERS